MATRLYIGRLHRDVREKDLERLFSRYGRIVDLRLMSGFGFVVRINGRFPLLSTNLLRVCAPILRRNSVIRAMHAM